MQKKMMVALLLLVGPLAFGQTDKPIHELYAQLIYNFIRYVQWPNENEPGDFVLGVIGGDNVYQTLKTLYEGKAKGQKEYVVKKLSSSSEAATCSVVFFW
jgi:hypothetical protein